MPISDGTAWTTLAKAKTWLQITDASQDSFVTALVDASQATLEKWLGRQLKQKTYTEYHDGDGTGVVLADVTPIISITTLHDDVDRTFAAASLIAATDYVFEANEGTVKLFRNTMGISSPAGAPGFSRGLQNIKLVYEAGYATIPSDAELACWMHVSWLKNRQNTEGFTAMSLGGKSETYEEDQFPKYIKNLISGYRRFGRYTNPRG